MTPGTPSEPQGDRVQPMRRLPSRGDASSRFDPSVPHPARVYNVWLGGKDNYAADRNAADQVIWHRPQVVAGARANRHFLARVVRFLVSECGTRQFIDIGTGLPAPDNTHEVAQRITPASRIVYVDNDPLVLAHARALLTSTPQGTCDYIDADLRDTAAILGQAARTLDFTQPAAALLLAVLHFVPDADDPAGIVKALAAGLAPGSYIAISHLTADLAPATVTAGVQAYNTLVPQSLTPRTRAQVTALFAGLPLIPPGVVPVTGWHPGIRDPRPPAHDLYAGLARTPPAVHVTAPGCGPRDPQEHDTAARIEGRNPRWAVIWGTHSRRYFAFPRFTTPPGTIITAPATTELLNGMRHAELTAATLRRRP